MKTKAVLISFFALFILLGCGYKIVLTGTAAAFTIYPTAIDNRSDDIESTSPFKDEVIMYLSSISALGKEDTAEYTGEFTLTQMTNTGASRTSSTTTAYINITMQIKVTDSEGNVAMNRAFSASENYDNTPSQSTTRANKEMALKDAVKRAMMDFRNAFESK